MIVRRKLLKGGALSISKLIEERALPSILRHNDSTNLFYKESRSSDFFLYNFIRDVR